MLEEISVIFFQTLFALYILFFFFLPIVFGYAFFKAWVKYAQAKFLSEQKYVLLELRVPKEITKSPAAMELFLHALYQGGGEGNWYDKFVKGGMRTWFSLELVSIEGQVKFFIWSRAGFRKVIESQLYGQYPDIEIMEAEDYTEKVHFDENTELFGCHFEKTKDSFYPIKTYVDYGLEDNPKEEYKIDPITAMIEFLGSLQRDEQVWIQIVIRVHKKEMTKPGTWFEKVDWKHFAKAEIDSKMKRKKDDGVGGDKLTKGEKGAVDAIEDSISKLAFDTGIRALYIAKKDIFNKANVSGLTGSFRQYSSDNLNGLKPGDTTSFDYPWQDFKNYRLNKKKEKMMKYYKQRAFFSPGYSYGIKTFVFNVQEIATIFHFPGDVSQTPTFSRIMSRKSEAPSNLPI